MSVFEYVNNKTDYVYFQFILTFYFLPPTCQEPKKLSDMEMS